MRDIDSVTEENRSAQRPRGAGRRQLLAALAERPDTRPGLAARTALSPAAVSTLTTDLIAEGVVTETQDVVAGGGTGTRRGRPAYLLALRPPDGLVVGIDVGNTHVRVAAAPVGGPAVAERSVAAGTASLDDTLDLVEELVDEVLGGAGDRASAVRAVVLGVPAPLERETGRVADNNLLPHWVGHRPGAELARRLGIDVVVENDANLGAVGELRHAPEAARTLAYIKLGTGIGAGLVTDGRLFRGEGGTAGEIGHVQVEPAGVLCRCGSRGCLETVVSLPRLVGALAPVTSDDLTPDALGALVADGHPGAVRIVTDAGRTVGRVVATLVTVLNPGLVVLGGSVAPVNELLAACIRAAVVEWATPAAAARVRVRASRRADRGEVEGALALASELALETHRVALLG